MPRVAPSVMEFQQPLKRSRLRKMSARKRRRLPARRECLRIVRQRSGGLCEARVPGVCTRYACDGHEVKSRGRGGDDTDPNNVRDCCRACHDWAHENPTAAKELGLLRNSWE